jgi:hypothetical protein
MCQYLNSNEVSFHKSCEKKEDKWGDQRSRVSANDYGEKLKFW